MRFDVRSKMKNTILTFFALILLAACDQAAKHNQTKATYQPSDFLKSFDAGMLVDSGWRISSRSETKRIYGGQEGSYRKGRVSFVSTSHDLASFPEAAIRAGFDSAPGFQVDESGAGREYRYSYGESGRFIGSITAGIQQTEGEIVVTYEVVENPNGEIDSGGNGGQRR